MFNRLKKHKEKTDENAKVERKEQEDKEFNDALDASWPIASEILKIIVEEKVPFVRDPNAKDGERPPEAEKATKRILELLLKEDIPWGHRAWIFQLMNLPTEYVKNCVLTDLERSYENQMCQIMGVEDFSTMRFSDVDNALKRLMPNAKKEG